MNTTLVYISLCLIGIVVFVFACQVVFDYIKDKKYIKKQLDDLKK